MYAHKTKNNHQFAEHSYRPLTKLREGNVFTGVCDSVHRGVVRGCSGGACVVAPGGGGCGIRRDTEIQ